MKSIFTTIVICIYLLSLVFFTSCGRLAPHSTKKITKQDSNLVIGEGRYAIDARRDTTSEVKDSSLSIQYLGCGGLLIEKDHEQILVDPYFSNQPILKVGLSSVKRFYKYQDKNKKKKKNKCLRIKPDRDLIDQVLRDTVHLSHVNTVMLSHAHYDHLLDYPYIYDRYLKGDTSAIKIIGNKSSYQLMQNFERKPNHRFIPIEDTDLLTTHTHMGNSIPLNDARSIRVYAIASDHAPHLASIKLFDGEARDTLVYQDYIKGTYAHQWREGKTFAFLIEFIHEKDTFRVFIQSSPSCPNDGFLPETSGKNIDLAIIGIANYDNAVNYPDALIQRMNPTQILLVHWEDFFRPYDKKKSKLVRGTDIAAYLTRGDVKEKIRLHTMHLVRPLTRITVKTN